MYQNDLLKDYINNSSLRIFSKDLRVRMSSELTQNYDKGYYNNYLTNIQNSYNMIKNLNINYPGNAHPKLYIYIVPDESFKELLDFPKHFKNAKGGGRPVRCFDLDGFNRAYGISQNIAYQNEKETKISRIENEIHELSHLVHCQFFSKNRTINEGFAEALPLYVLDIESIFDEHIELLKSLDENKILTAKELIESERDKTFGVDFLEEGKTCSFRTSYLSSYLLIRGCLETIVRNNNCSKIESLQYFLEIVRSSKCSNEYLIFDIADAIGIDREELLKEKNIQLEVIKNICNQKNNDKVK